MSEAVLYIKHAALRSASGRISIATNGQLMLLTEFTVTQNLYQGPMDLLLHLVRRHEVDITQIAMAKVTAEFLELLEVLEMLDFDLIGDFLVTASTLLEIKSREVLPRYEEVEEDESEVDESSSNLIRHLLEYRRYKDAAVALEEQASQWQQRYPRRSSDRPDLRRDHSADRIREVELWDLVSAFSRIVKRPEIEDETRIQGEEIPLSAYQAEIRERLRSEERVAFTELFHGERVRSRIVGLFLAILELIRHEAYRAVQSDRHGEIWIMSPLPVEAE